MIVHIKEKALGCMQMSKAAEHTIYISAAADCVLLSMSSGRRVSLRQTSIMPSHPFRSVSQVNEVTGTQVSFPRCRHLDPMWNINKLNRSPNAVVLSRWSCL